MTATYVDNIDTVSLLIQVGDGASPEVFAHPILVNTQRGYSKTAATTAGEIPRTDDPTQPSKTVRTTTSTDSSITGAGVLPASLAKAWNDMVGQTKNLKVQAGSITGALIVSGPYILTKFEISGTKLGDEVAVSVQFDQADQPTSTAHS